MRIIQRSDGIESLLIRHDDEHVGQANGGIADPGRDVMMNRMSGRLTDIFGSSGVRAQLSWSAQCGKILNNQKPRNRPVKRTTKTQMGLLTPRLTLAACEFATR